MFRFVVALVALAYASAFAPARVARSSSAISMNIEGMSKSVPFLRKPKNLDGLVVRIIIIQDISKLISFKLIW
jgi:hypothetical protein